MILAASCTIAQDLAALAGTLPDDDAALAVFAIDATDHAALKEHLRDEIAAHPPVRAAKE